ncbi:MAG TPA: bifunctional serine/threonine-protein kinase/formylglycine-generating enzyme family protein [Pyrinomonadaceae bacterium]|nr:bifunctional serine/threonine-protein kinase/formylglycine-generating enzyme family protein [Pyrinomonadaceae bacterium]
MKECPVCNRCFPDHVNHCPGDGNSLRFTIAGDTTLDGRYQLEKRLGQGGMGMVFKARHIFLKTQHAIKVILPDLVGNDPSLVTRFRQEAMAAAAITHPNTISVTDFGVIGGTTPFLVMEFVEGRSLHDILQEEGRLPAERALEIMLAVCAGVGAAHRQGIVHRDLKPLNILLKSDQTVSEGVKVLDFGLAKIKSGEVLGSFVAAQTQGMMGSPFYMAPEQWSDEDIDVRADIYSLGIILYQMLSGDVPFKGVSIPSIMKKHLTETPPSLAARGVNVPGALEGAVRHALEKELEARPASIEEFTAELREGLSAVVAARASDGLGMKTLQIGLAETLGVPAAGRGGQTGDVRAGATGSGVGANAAANNRDASPATDLPREAVSQITVVAQPAESGTDTSSHPDGETALLPEAVQLAGEERRRAEAEERERAEAEEERARRAVEEAERREAAAEAQRREEAEEARRKETAFRVWEEEQARRRAAVEEQERREAQAAEQREAEARRSREAEERERREAEERKPREEDEHTLIAARQGATREAVVSHTPTAEGVSSTVGARPASSAPLIVLVVIVVIGLAGLVGIAALFMKGFGGGTTNANAGPGVNANAVGGTTNTNAGTTTPDAPTRPEMVSLPGGTFQVGRGEVPPVSGQYSAPYLIWMYSQWPAHAVNIRPFAIDRTEVTNAEYAEFVKATGHAPPPDVWGGQNPKAGEERWPVRNVSFDDAQAFAAWRSKRDGVSYRLPTEDEWEYAARGGDASRLYPWGGEWAEGRANFNSDAPRPVGSFPEGRTPQGVDDMIGNVWEWTSSTAAMYKGNDRTKLLEQDRGKMVTRGGSYRSLTDADPKTLKAGDEPVAATARRWFAKDYRDPAIGFRLVRDEGQ